MKEVLLLKCGEIVLKGLNRKTFEDRLLKNLKRRMAHVADCEISMRQSVVYVEIPEEADADAVMECACRVFGFATISRAAVCPEKTLESVIATAKDYLAPNFAAAKTFKVETKRGDTVCFIENIDPVGVHTGDSFCSAPMLTISEEVQKKLQDQAYRIVDAIEVIGGTNVQFAHDPISGRVVVIEINPRTSRSSALASKATGFPIALVSAMLASGLTLDEIPCGKYGTLDKYVPDGDYIVLKFARWAFEKFKRCYR